jgi:hypothetical protein
MIREYLHDLRVATLSGWNQFWFTPCDPATLGAIRICAGFMLFYTHLVWTKDLLGFLGNEGRLSADFVRQFHGSGFGWSHLLWIESPAAIWLIHMFALAVFVLLTIGFASRTISVLAFLLTVSYAHRAAGALFGLDQINVMLAMYLMVGPSGAAFSVDRLRSHTPSTTSITANIAIRLIQVHMCVIYLFAGLGKLQGASWWDGTAMWLSLANYEYQSVDMTWLGHWPWLINFLTHVTVFWEVSYCVLVWPRLTRPIVLFLAVPLHLGIAICLGMITFGTAMLIGNLAFVSPTIVRHLLDRRAGETTFAAT